MIVLLLSALLFPYEITCDFFAFFCKLTYRVYCHVKLCHVVDKKL